MWPGSQWGCLSDSSPHLWSGTESVMKPDLLTAVPKSPLLKLLSLCVSLAIKSCLNPTREPSMVAGLCFQERCPHGQLGEVLKQPLMLKLSVAMGEPKVVFPWSCPHAGWDGSGRAGLVQLWLKNVFFQDRMVVLLCVAPLEAQCSSKNPAKAHTIELLPQEISVRYSPYFAPIHCGGSGFENAHFRCSPGQQGGAEPS